MRALTLVEKQFITGGVTLTSPNVTSSSDTIESVPPMSASEKQAYDKGWYRGFVWGAVGPMASLISIGCVMAVMGSVMVWVLTPSSK